MLCRREVVKQTLILGFSLRCAIGRREGGAGLQQSSTPLERWVKLPRLNELFDLLHLCHQIRTAGPHRCHCIGDARMIDCAAIRRSQLTLDRKIQALFRIIHQRFGKKLALTQKSGLAVQNDRGPAIGCTDNSTIDEHTLIWSENDFQGHGLAGFLKKFRESVLSCERDLKT